MNEKQIMKKLEKITSRDVKKAVDRNWDSWEEYIREEELKDLKAAKLARNFWVKS